MLSTTDVIGLISALGVGSVIGGIVTQLLSRRSEKRQLRAKISEELSAVRALGPPVNDSQAQIKREDELVTAQVRLRSAAMLAHLPRKLVEGYSRLTAAALHSSKESLAANGRGSVPGAVAECLDAAHRLMSDLLWQPVRTRITHPFRFWWLRRRVTQNKLTPAGANLRWSTTNRDQRLPTAQLSSTDNTASDAPDRTAYT